MTPPALDGDPDRPLDDGGHDPLYDCIIDDDNFEVSHPPYSLLLNVDLFGTFSQIFIHDKTHAVMIPFL